jgi:2-methylcitrate dehydratase PrpD
VTAPITLAQELAQRIAATRFEHLTPGAIRQAKIGLLDTLAVGIAGCGDDAALIARKVSGSHTGSALVWGTGHRSSALDAAFMNGVAANVLDFDDSTDNLGGHPSSPILPALIALAEERHAAGRDVLTAYVAGFETETSLGRGVNFHHYEKGWHPTSTLGVFGAAAACARLLELDHDRSTRALALCASLAAGVKANLGSMGKPMHIGQCSRSGLLAALLAAEGFTGNADALEHPQGFLELFNGAGTYSVERILAKWGTPWDIELPGIAVKQYPCCLSTQSAVDLMIGLVAENDVAVGAVSRIEAAVSARRLEHTDRPAPRSALDAKLSIQYVLARALTDRAVSLAHFEGDAYRQPDVQRVMQQVAAVPFDEGTLAQLGDPGAAIAITLKDGRRLTGTIGRPVGHEPGVPIPSELHRKKFEACVSRRLSDAQSADLYNGVQDFENVTDVAAFTRSWESEAPPASIHATGQVSEAFLPPQGEG